MANKKEVQTKKVEKTGKIDTKKRKNPKARRHTMVNQLGNAITRFERLVGWHELTVGETTSRPINYTLSHEENAAAYRIRKLRDQIRRGFQPCWWPVS